MYRRRSALEAHVAEPTLLVFLLQADIQHLFPVAVLDAGSARLLAFPVDHADLVHDGRRQVVQGRALVVEEEGPAAHGELVDLLAVEFDLAVLGDLHARHPLQQVLQHRIGPDPEGGGVELDRVLLDDDRVAHVRDRGRLQEVLIDLHPDGAHVHFLVAEVPFLHEGLVPHHFHVEEIVSIGDFLQLGYAQGVRQGEIGDGRVFGRNDIHGRERHGLVGERVQDGGLDVTHPALENVVIEDEHLRPCAQAHEKAQEYRRDNLLHSGGFRCNN